MPITVVKIERFPGGIEIKYSDGTREEIDNGQYEAKDAAGKTIIERPVTPADIARFNLLDVGTNTPPIDDDGTPDQGSGDAPGTVGDDDIVGTIRDDQISARNGDDKVRAGVGDDVVTGGNGADDVRGGAGDDNISGNAGSDDLHGDTGNDIIRGGSGDDKLRGDAGRDRLFGDAGKDDIGGDSGNDILSGGAGIDKLDGGFGRDVMTGGTGRDRFDFDAVSESGKTSATRDRITDFSHGNDDIDLRTIDANGTATGNGAFSFLATEGASFTGIRGQLRWQQVDSTDPAKDRTVVSGDINGDGKTDFQIELTGLKTLTAGDFLL